MFQDRLVPAGCCRVGNNEFVTHWQTEHFKLIQRISLEILLHYNRCRFGLLAIQVYEPQYIADLHKLIGTVQNIGSHF